MRKKENKGYKMRWRKPYGIDSCTVFFYQTVELVGEESLNFSTER